MASLSGKGGAKDRILHDAAVPSVAVSMGDPSGDSPAFLGSVAEKVLHRIRIPVFIIPLPEEKGIASQAIR